MKKEEKGETLRRTARDGRRIESERASRRSCYYSTPARRGRETIEQVVGGEKKKRERKEGREREGDIWEGFRRVGELRQKLRDDHEERGGELDRRGLDKDRPPFPLESHVLVYVEERGERRSARENLRISLVVQQPSWKNVR